MKNFKVVIGLLVFFSFCALLLLVFQVRKAIQLHKEIASQEKILQEVTSAQQEVSALQKKVSDLYLIRERIRKMVPENESQPLQFIRELSVLGDEFSVKNMRISYGQDKDDGDIPNSHADSSSNGNEQEGQDSFSEETGAKATALALKLECDVSFTNLILFLKKLAALDRIVAIKGIKVQRVDDQGSFQKVTLQFDIYTFLTEGY